MYAIADRLQALLENPTFDDIRVRLAVSQPLTFLVCGQPYAHLHPDGTLHCRFSLRVRAQLLKEQQAAAHNIIPNSGWVMLNLDLTTEMEHVVWLLRLANICTLMRSKTLRWQDPSILHTLHALNLSDGVWYAITRTERCQQHAAHHPTPPFSNHSCA